MKTDLQHGCQPIDLLYNKSSRRGSTVPTEDIVLCKMNSTKAKHLTVYCKQNTASAGQQLPVQYSQSEE